MLSQTHAGVWEMCTDKILQNGGFTKVLKDLFPNELTDAQVQINRDKIYIAFAGAMLESCGSELMDIADLQEGLIILKKDDKTIGFKFSVPEIFDHLDFKAGIMVYNNKTKTAGSIIKLSDIKSLYWSDDCSDHTIWENLDDDAAVNIAGQKVFQSYGGSKNEFFLDFEEGNNRRAFPGLVLMDKTYSTSESIVVYTNLITAKQVARQFAEALSNTACSNQGLAVYLVALNVTKSTTSGNEGVAKGIGYSVGGLAAANTLVGAGLGVAGATGTTAVLGTTAGAAGFNAAVGVAGTVTAKGMAAGALAGAGASVGWIPGPGWVIGGALLIAAGVTYAISVAPSEIEDIQQVAVLAGPYIIR